MNDQPNNQRPPIQWPTSQDDDKAANVARSKVQQVYNQPDRQQHTHHPRTAENLQQYHNAWQSYYQEYFKRYYAHVSAQAKEQEKTEPEKLEEIPTKASERKKVAADIRDKVRKKAEERAQKIKKSHHFKPILAALGVGLIFLFINYNQVVFGGVKQYLSPSLASNTPIIITPDSGGKVGAEPMIIIPKIGVQAPVVYSEKSYDENKVEAALEHGTLHYGTTALPGQIGNVSILGHSSNNVFTPGAYKYVFVNLDRLDVGDTIYLNYKGQRFTYKVSVAHKVVPPNDVSVIAPTTKPIVTLITCTPAGTNLNRLIVQAEQIDPSPSKDTAPRASGTQPQSLPATSRGIIGSFF
jgi:sortase A